MRRNVIDRLALLCTLHADGPRTTRLLREAGCTTLDKLQDLEPKRLAKILGLSPAAARRLLREVALLQDRLEPDLEREEVMYPPAADAGGMKPAPPGYLRVGPTPEAAPVQREEPADTAEPPRRADLDVRDRRLLDAVVDRWRKADETSRRKVEEETPPVQEPVDEQPTHEVVEISVHPPPGMLRAGDLSGLDEGVCEALYRGGITSLEELATCPVDALVERSRLSFTRARTLQFLAGRRLAEMEDEKPSAERTPEAAVRATPEAEERISLASPARRSIPLESSDLGQPGGDEGVGGPFA